MDADSFPVDMVSWDSAISLSRSLADIIRASGLAPDLVIAIGRGGYVPARVVCDRLLISDLTSIKIEHWGVAAREFDRAVVRFHLSVNVEGKTILVIDDVTDTGETLITATEYLARHRPGVLRTGVLQHKTCSAFQPDYYAERIAEWKWIIYPWALHEDMIGFLEKVLGDQPVSPEDLARFLGERFKMYPDMGEVILALDDMVSLGIASRRDGQYFAAGNRQWRV
ncbi:MAG: phosphoribosyltransferase [Methanoregulaceae archaeon]